jgi:DNA-binding transcriptional MerR regulator
MPYKEKIIEKRYYSIAEVAKMFNVNKSLLRFWETEFDEIKPKKSNTGNRLYTQKEIEKLKIIYSLVKEKGFTLDGAKAKMKEPMSEDLESKDKVIESLTKIKSFLISLEGML